MDGWRHNFPKLTGHLKLEVLLCNDTVALGTPSSEIKEHISFRLHTSNQRISRELLLKQSRQGNKALTIGTSC
jgi:hypothetical protein